MNSVERVKEICKERKIAISKLERDCGFSNGYIGQLKKGTFPEDRLRIIAEYLELSPEYLATGEEPEETPTYYLDEESKQMAEFLCNNKDYKILFDAMRTVRPTDIQKVKDFIDEQNGNT